MTIEKADGQSAAATKLMAVMGLGVKCGDTVTVKIEGGSEGNPDKEVFPVGDNRMMRERHAVVSFSYLLYSGDKSISPIKV